MKTKLYLNIAFRIILLGAIGILGSYLPDHLHTFFGDTYYPKGFEEYSGLTGTTIEYWDWGVRHYWYQATVIALFLLTLLNALISIIESIKKHYPNVF